MVQLKASGVPWISTFGVSKVRSYGEPRQRFGHPEMAHGHVQTQALLSFYCQDLPFFILPVFSTFQFSSCVDKSFLSRHILFGQL